MENKRDFLNYLLLTNFEFKYSANFHTIIGVLFLPCEQCTNTEPSEDLTSSANLATSLSFIIGLLKESIEIGI